MIDVSNVPDNGSFTDTFAQWDVHVYHFSSTATSSDFSLSASPASQTVAQGGSTTYTTTFSNTGPGIGGLKFTVGCSYTVNVGGTTGNAGYVIGGATD